MSKIEKLLSKARNSHNSFKFSDFESLLESCGWILDHQKGSHRIWYSPGGERLPIQPKGSEAKSYQVKQFLDIYDQETSNGIR